MTLTTRSMSYNVFLVKLLCPMVQEKIHLQENTSFDLGVFDLDPKFEVATSKTL